MQRVYACLLISTQFLLSMYANAEHQQGAMDHGAAFSDPGEVIDKSPEWKAQKITYDKKLADVDVVISLGQQTYPALHRIVEEIAKSKGIKVSVLQGSCGVTAKRLRSKSVDVGTFCCPPGKIDRLPGLQFHTVAIAPIAFVTNKVNPVDNLTSDEARRVFHGDYVHWSDIPSTKGFDMGFLKQPIKPVVRLHCKKRPGHWKHLLENEDQFSPRAQEVGVIPDMINQVSVKKTGIGYETPYMLEVHKKMGELKILKIDGIDPRDLKSLLNNKYPFYRTYNMTTWTSEHNANQHAQQLVEDLIVYLEKNGEKMGFIPVSHLHRAGWKFSGTELVGESDGKQLVSEHASR